VQHLARDEVEEACAVTDGQQRLGLVEAHRGSQAAVQLDDGCVRQRLARFVGVDLTSASRTGSCIGSMSSSAMVPVAPR
jgi:hypothetical protein